MHKTCPPSRFSLSPTFFSPFLTFSGPFSGNPCFLLRCHTNFCQHRCLVSRRILEGNDCPVAPSRNVPRAKRRWTHGYDKRKIKRSDERYRWGAVQISAFKTAWKFSYDNSNHFMKYTNERIETFLSDSETWILRHEICILNWSVDTLIDDKKFFYPALGLDDKIRIYLFVNVFYFCKNNGRLKNI